MDTRLFHRECVSLARWYNVTAIGLGTGEETCHGVRLVGLCKPRNRLFRMIRTTHQAYLQARRMEADLYHFHDPELIPWAWRLHRSGKPVVYDIHENMFESLKSKDWLPFKTFFSWCYARMEAWAARRFHFVLAERSYQDVYKIKYPWKGCTLVQNFTPPGFLHHYQKTKRPVDPLQIFYMGSLDSSYCLEPMLDSIRELRRRHRPVRLILVGRLENPLRAAMEQRCCQHGIGDLVEFCGHLDFQQGYARSVDCACGYCFVGDNANMTESVPRKLYEYLQVGLPVISSGFPLYRSIVESNNLGVCIPECTGNAIADAVEQLVSDPDELNRKAANAVWTSENRYDWETQAQKLRDLYQAILTVRRREHPAGTCR